MEREHLIKMIDDYASASGLTPGTICQYALKRSHLYHRLRAGGECLPRTAKRLADWISEHPPSSRPTVGE